MGPMNVIERQEGRQHVVGVVKSVMDEKCSQVVVLEIKGQSDGY